MTGKHLQEEAITEPQAGEVCNVLYFENVFLNVFRVGKGLPSVAMAATSSAMWNI